MLSSIFILPSKPFDPTLAMEIAFSLCHCCFYTYSIHCGIRQQRMFRQPSPPPMTQLFILSKSWIRNSTGHVFHCHLFPLTMLFSIQSFAWKHDNGRCIAMPIEIFMPLTGSVWVFTSWALMHAYVLARHCGWFLSWFHLGERGNGNHLGEKKKSYPSTFYRSLCS